MKNKSAQSGQALLLVLLAMAVLATMTLSVVSRTISDVNVATTEEESLRAFSAAEAGIEEALVTGEVDTTVTRDLEVESGSEGSGTTIVSTYTANVESYPEDATKFSYPFEFLSGEAGTVWFKEDVTTACGSSNACFTGDEIDLCWAKPGNEGDPAVFVNIIYETGSGFANASSGYDRNVSRANSNNFAGASTGQSIGGQTFVNCADIDLTNFGPNNLNIRSAGTPVLMRVSMLYNSVPQAFGVSTNSALPSQGKKVSSEGSSGDVTRKVDAFLLNPEMPYIFDSALYSEGDIAK